MSTMTVTGQCLCGAVAFTGIPNVDAGVSVCHCGQCRRWGSGPYFSMQMEGGVTLTRAEGLVWYASSDFAERGFCRECGASLFWREKGDNDWAVSVGALEDGHGLQIAEHIWIDDKPSFYDLADGAPRKTAAQCTAEENKA